MASSMNGAIHLGLAEIYKSTRFENIEHVFNITQKIWNNIPNKY